MKITTVYFSATYTTHRIVSHLAKRLSKEVKEYDITNNAPSGEIVIPNDELLIVGIPVYAGRVPKMAVDRIHQFKGKGTPAIAVAVYGNRHYDDALLELSDLLSENGFQIISAGAFIAQHSIFPKVGAHRPDADDYLQINVFADETNKIFHKNREKLLPIHIPGKRPYKIPGSIPIYPSGTNACKECGKCMELCPTGAIAKSTPKEVDQTKCIKCGRCIVVCPTKSRKFRGLKYMMASLKFNHAYKERREPEMFFARYN